MPVRNNPVLGVIECDSCGGEATVHQTARGKSRFLYTRCPACGADQRSGATVQTRLWNQTEWRDDANPIKPPNVSDEQLWEEITGSHYAHEPEKNPETRSTAHETKKSSKFAPVAFVALLVGGLFVFGA
jgi:ribosomal protein S27E